MKRQSLVAAAIVVGFAGLSEADLDTMYWVRDGGTFWKADLGGSGVQYVMTRSLTTMALDSVHDKLYWANAGAIMRANLDGSSVEQLTGTSGFGIDQIALDPLGDTMYWVRDGGTFWKADLGGSGVQYVMTQSLTTMALDSVHDKLYWANGGAILRANLDGSLVEQLTGWSPFDIYEIAFDFQMDEPAVVPAPGAALLGTLGLSYAGWHLRRRMP